MVASATQTPSANTQLASYRGALFAIDFMDLSLIPDGCVIDLDVRDMALMASFLGTADPQRNWIALIDKMTDFLDRHVKDSLYQATMYQRPDVAALKLLNVLKEKNIKFKDLAKALKEMQNVQALSLLFPPAPLEIVRQPLSYKARAEEKITLTFEVTGNPPPSIQWWTTKDDDYTAWTPISGARDSSLTIYSLHIQNEGQYCCQAYSRSGEVVCSDIVDLVLDPRECGPMIVQQPETPKFCFVGGSVCLSCKAVAYPDPEYQWYYNNNRLRDRTEATLNVQVGGLYHCVISNSIGKATSCKAQVSVYKKDRRHSLPIRTEMTASVYGKPLKHKKSLSLGHNVELTVQFDQSERTESDGLSWKYQWHQNDKPIPNATEEKLCIEHIQDFHEGVYHCQISEEGINSDDNSVEHSSKLELHIAPPDLCKRRSRIQKQKQERVQMLKDDTSRKATDKVALLIGNFEYQKMPPLQYPEQDVITISGLLQQLGFKVLEYVNLDFFEMGHVLRTFYEMIHLGVYALVYFAGHGIEYHNETYMLPIDGDDEQEAIIEFREKAIEYEMQMREARLSVILLDCCRVSPRRCPSQPRCDLPSLGIGTVMTHYSCGSRQLAYEPKTSSSCSHSIYASQLTNALEGLLYGDPQPVHQLFTKVNKEVSEKRKGFDSMVSQVPQRKDQITETDLSLADEISQQSSVADENRKIYNGLYSWNTGLSEIYDRVQLQLQCRHWVGNVLLVGAQAQQCVAGGRVDLQFRCLGKQQDGFDYREVSAREVCNELKKRSQCCIDKKLPDQWKSLAKCDVFMKIYNIQRTPFQFQCLPIKIMIDGKLRCLELKFKSVSPCMKSSYQHGKRIQPCEIGCCLPVEHEQ